MLRSSLVCLHQKGPRFLSVYTPKCSSVQESAATTKHNYYKNLDSKADDTKPPGWDKAKPFSSIPGPKPVPIFGNLWRFLPVIGDLFRVTPVQLAEKFDQTYGTISILKGVEPFFKKFVFLSDPDDIELLFRNEGVWPIREGNETFTYYRKEVRNDIFQGVGGVVTTHGEEWFNTRSKVNPILMQPRVAQQYIKSMDIIAEEFLGRIKYFTTLNPEGEMPADFLNEINKWSLESIAFIAIDKRLGCLDPNLKSDSDGQVMINSVSAIFLLMYKLEFLPSLWRFYNTPNLKKLVKYLDTVTFILLKYIKEAEAKIKNAGDKPDHEMSVLQRLLKIDRKVAITMSMDMMTAGIDTTSKTTAAALYYLAKFPAAQQILREELKALLPNPNAPITKEVLDKANYLKAVIKETTRVAPIAVGNLRKTVKDMVIAGYQIPKGTDVATSNLMLSLTERHFIKAKEFIPERWLRTTQGEYSYKNTHAFVSLPFGFGPRSCIGKRLATLEMEVLLAKIIRNLEITWPHEDAVFKSDLLYGIATPLKLHIKPIHE